MLFTESSIPSVLPYNLLKRDAACWTVHLTLPKQQARQWLPSLALSPLCQSFATTVYVRAISEQEPPRRSPSRWTGIDVLSSLLCTIWAQFITCLHQTPKTYEFPHASHINYVFHLHICILPSSVPLLRRHTTTQTLIHIVQLIIHFKNYYTYTHKHLPTTSTQALNTFQRPQHTLLSTHLHTILKSLIAHATLRAAPQTV